MAGRPIDEKIVVMKLDNSDFTAKAANTTSSLGKLRDALNKIPGVNLGKTTEELGKIQNEANNTNLDKLASSVQSVASRFTTLGIMGVTALTNITNRAVDAGIAMAKSLSVDQISSGYQEYEQKIGAIGTMLSNTEWEGAKLSDVKATLADLNAYADKTVYSFGDMTENIGRFTAAGVKLKDSAIAIKGLGNLAAASGSNTEQLNNAMYQMSQGLAAGKIGLEDWNSLVNSGMGGKKTQDALVATAKAMGKNVDMSKGFRMSLQKGWLTSEVMLKTLKKFGEDESLTKAATSVRTFSALMDSTKEAIGSGWASTFEQIFGDFDESTKLFTSLSQSIGGYFNHAAEARNHLLAQVADGGGMQNLFKGIANAAKPIGQIFTAIATGFKQAFPPKTAEQIIKMTASFKEFTSGLALNQRQIGEITTIFHAVFSVFSTVILIAKELGKAFLNLIPKGTGDGILGLLANIARMVLQFTNAIKYGDGLSTSMGALGNVFGVIGSIIGSIFKGLGSLAHGFSSLGETISEVWSILVKGDFTGKGPWEEDSKIVDWLFKLRDAFKSVGDWFKNNFKGFGISDVLGAGTLVGIGLIVKKIMGIFDGLGGGFDSFKEMFENIGESVSGIFGDLGDSLQAFTSQVKYNNLLKIAIAVGILAVSLKLLEGMSIHDITKGIAALGISLGVMMTAMSIIDKFSITGGLRASTNLIALAIAVSIMAGALKKISVLKPDEIKRGVAGLVGVTATLAAAIIAMSKWGGKLKVGSLQLIALAGAVYILADAVKKMSSINPGDLFKSIGALGIIFLELAIFLKIVNKTKFGISSAIGLIAVAGAVQMMVNAIQDINKTDIPGLVKGLSAIAIILGEIVIFSKLVSGGKLISAGVGLILLASAINLLIPPITVFSKMSWTELAKGLTTMAVALALVAGAALLASGSIGGAIAIGIMAFAMNALIIPIKALGAMSWGDLAKGFVGLAGGLVLMAGAALLLSPAVVPMLAFGGALLLMGVAVLAVGAGIGLFAVGLATLATLTAASVTAIVAALALLLKGFAELIPGMVDFVVKLGLALINGIVALVPPLANAIASLIVSLLTTITTYLPSFIEKGTLLLMQLLEGMGKAVPTLISGAIAFIVELISGLAKGIRDNGPQLINAMMELIGEIIIIVIEAGTAIINAMFGWIPGVQGVTSKIGSTATKYIRDNFKASDVGNQKGSEFANALGGKAGAAQSAGSKVGQAGKSGAGSISLTSTGSGKGSEFASGLSSKISAASSSGKGLANGGKSGAGSVDMHGTGSNFGSGFASGISSAYNSVVSAAKRLAKSAASTVKGWLDIHSPSRVTRGFGKFFGEGLALGIDDKVKHVAASAKTLAMKATESLNQFLDGFKLPEDDNELKFKAVVDYDKLDTSKFGPVGNLPVTPNTSLTSGMVASIPTPNTTTTSAPVQNGDTLAMNKQQEQQINLLKQQNQLLSDISNKDNSVYLDGKAMYNNSKSIQNNQTVVRNIFKGVSAT